ncbi:MAG: polyphosphate kinase 1 [Bacillota bacterium]|nr:polyphosphate kinase 1 [Bacillota bacterium]
MTEDRSNLSQRLRNEDEFKQEILSKDQRKQSKDIFKYSKNRELSWLNFNKRVLEEALDPATPDFESLKFISIFTSNFEEFYRVRVGSLTDLTYLFNKKIDNKTGMSPEDQLDAIYQATKPLLKEKDQIYQEVMDQLAKSNIFDLDFSDLTKKEKKYVSDYYEDYVKPVLSPQIIDHRHPFPFIENNSLSIILELKEKERDTYALVQIPEKVKRFINLNREEGIAIIRIENIIKAHIDSTLANYDVKKAYVFKVTRNADINIEDYLEEDEDVYKKKDYKNFMKTILKKRSRLQVVDLVSNEALPKNLESFLVENLEISSKQVFVSSAPLIMDYVFTLEDLLREKSLDSLLYPSFSPQKNPMINENKGLIDQVLEKDFLFIYPYEDVGQFIQLLDQAATDPRVFSIKITIYRLAKNSKIVRSLLKALDNGKEVTVVMELQARFDEESNINYSDVLLEAGCNIIYGVEGYKVHSKVVQISLEDQGQIKYINQIGTGNYNEKTSKQYSDLSLLTADPRISTDVSNLFKNLNIGNVKGYYENLLVSPVSFKVRITDLIEKEIAKGKEGRIFFKFNSFTDKDLMIKLSQASMAGVQVRLIIRGISCLRPQVPGYTDNIEIRSIVGRYLEHPRIYIFGQGPDSQVFIGSADLMTRNTEKRVEVASPIYDPEIKEKIIAYMEGQWADNTKARLMNAQGSYDQVPNPDNNEAISSQDSCMAKAISNYENMTRQEKESIKEKDHKEADPAEEKSLWQSIVDFFARLFSK